MTPDAHPLTPWLTPERRAWLYRLALPIAGLAVLVGVLTEELAGSIIGIVVAFLSTGTAALHTPTKIVTDEGDPFRYTYPAVKISGPPTLGRTDRGAVNVDTVLVVLVAVVCFILGWLAHAQGFAT